MDSVLVALSGVVLGVSLAGPPGPVTAIMVRRATESVMKGAIVGFGAMSADLILMILTFLFRSQFNLTAYDPYIFLLGSFFFILIAYFIAKSGKDESQTKRYNSGYVAGISIGLVNPMQIGWWLIAGLGFYSKFGLFPFYFLFIGIIFWVFFLSILVYKFSNRYGSAVNTGVRIFSVISLTAFGLYFLYLGLLNFI